MAIWWKLSESFKSEYEFASRNWPHEISESIKIVPFIKKCICYGNCVSERKLVLGIENIVGNVLSRALKTN